MARSARPRSRKGATVVCADFDTTFLTNFTCPATIAYSISTFKIDRDPDALFQTQFRFARIVQRRKFFRDDLV